MVYSSDLELERRGAKEVVQILADKDVVFPVKNSAPDYIIKGASHLFPVTRAKEVSDILRKVFG